MAEHTRDQNGVLAMAGVLNTDGVTVTRIKINESTHVLDVADAQTGSDLGKDVAARDNSGVPGLIATDTDGNIINLYVDSSGRLLVDSN